jgi:hypothetical protein
LLNFFFNSKYIIINNQVFAQDEQIEIVQIVLVNGYSETYDLKSIIKIDYCMLLLAHEIRNLHILTNTPDAPRANALKTSVPRRTPPSIKTGTLPSAASTTYSR